MAKDSRLARAGVSGYNKPKRTPSHKTKSHVVVAKEGGKVRLLDLDNKEFLVTELLLKGQHHLKQDTLKI